jgi:hypothetical protein
MRTRLGFIPLVVVVVLVLVGTVPPTSALAGPASRAGIASTKCSRAAAQAALLAHPKFDPEVPKHAAQVLCGAFLGSGSRAMVVSFAAGACGPGSFIRGWGVYRLKAGKWQPTWKYQTEAERIATDGHGIEETIGIYLQSDVGCNATGGTETRTWHWNGRTFVASAWTRHLAPAPAPATSSRLEFDAAVAGGGFECNMSYQREDEKTACVSHGSKEGVLFQQLATLQPNGQLATCSQQGTENRCELGNLGVVPTFPAGKVVTVGPFTCKVLETGVECTVTATGKGFLITPETLTEVGG